ncbi:MAG: DUF2783 domain-containing protein [Parvularculaceae bacterium]
MKLVTDSNIADPDGIYQRLIALHQDRSEEDSRKINARLILLLINHVGDRETVMEAIELAFGTARTEG